MLRKMMKRQRGFTLIELLIVVAIIGIIAALLIPNFLDSLQKAKQKRTMADMRNMGTAMMTWLTDEAGAAAAGAGVPVQSYDTNFVHDQAGLEATLIPFYVQAIPPDDGWKHPFNYALNTANPLAIRVMGVQSRGRDSDLAEWSWKADATVPAVSGPYDPLSYDNDIVWLDGGFVIWPQKVQ